MASIRKPNLFIVGAPKCGTTALNHYLSAHPDIFMAKKETHFFGSDLRFGPQFQLYRRYPDEYRAAFAARNGQTWAGETSVWYLFSQQAAAEIKAFSPDARIIIMLRDPTAMLYSLYCQFLADGNEYLPTFKEALAAESDRQAGLGVRRQTYLVQALAYRATARFSEQVRRYFDVFGRERVHVIVYDDFNADTANVYHQTLDFLGVASSSAATKFEVINGSVNGNNSVRSKAVRAILNDRYVRETAVALRAWLPRRVFMAIKNAGVNLNEFNFIKSRSKRTPIDPELEDSLRREFTTEVERLSDLLRRDLTDWSKPGRVLRPTSRLSAANGHQHVLNKTGIESSI